MAAAFDAVSFATPVASGVGTVSWTHTPVGTPRGVLVFVPQGNNGGVPSGVTYGGQAMTEVALSPAVIDAGTDLTVTAWFLGTGIPTGAQSVVVGTGTNDPLHGICYTLTASGDTEVIDTGAVGSASIDDPSSLLELGGRTSFIAVSSSANAVNTSNITTISGAWTQDELRNPWAAPGTVVSSTTHLTSTTSSDTTAGVLHASAYTTAQMAVAIAEVAGGGSGVTGTFGVTEGADSIAASGDVLVQGSAAVTEGLDVASVTGSILVQGSLAVTEGNDTAAISGAVEITGSLSVTEGADTAAIVGSVVIAGALAVTEGADTITVNGGSSIQGSLIVTEGADTLSSTGQVLVSGTLVVTEGSDTVAVTGQVHVTGTLAVTEGADNISVSGGNVSTGSMAVTEGSDTVSASGVVRLSGTLTVSELPDTAALSGQVRITGTLAVTEGSDTVSITTRLVNLGVDITLEATYTHRVSLNAESVRVINLSAQQD